MVKVLVSKIKPGSLHLRAIHKRDAELKYPPYFNHTVLEPLGNHGCELKGLSNPDSARKLIKVGMEIAKDTGYTYLIITRIKNDEQRYLIYWL